MQFVSEFEGDMGKFKQHYPQIISSGRLGKQAFGLLSMVVLGMTQAEAAIATQASEGLATQAISSLPTKAAAHNPKQLAMKSATGDSEFATQPIAGQLKARDVNGVINIRKQPTVRSPIRSEGSPQDPLYIFKSALNPEGQRWYFVENVPTGEQGWVREDFVQLNEPGQRFPRVSSKTMKIDPMTGTVDWVQPHAIEEWPEGGIIFARDKGTWVNVRSQPSTDSTVLHTALSGDPIYIYRTSQFSSPAGQVRANEFWFFVAFLESGAEGWVRSDFIESAWESDEPFEADWSAARPGRLQSPQNGNKVQLLQRSYDESSRVGWGQAGEAVTLLRKLETSRGDRHQAWYFIELGESGLQGWVRGSYVLEL